MVNRLFKPLESCLEKITYTTKIQRKDFLESGDFPVISQESEFINGYWNSENDLFRIKKPVVIFWDHTQVLKYVDFDFVLGADGVKILQPNDFLDTRFFYYFLQGVDLWSLGYARHYRLLKEIQIPLPFLSEQLRIVSILDEAFEKLDQTKRYAEKNLQNAKEVFESYLQGVFMNPGEDWETRTMEDVCEIQSKLIDPRESEFLDMIHVGAGNIETKTGLLVDLKTSREENLISGKFQFDDSMVLYSKIRPYLMKVVRPGFQGLCSADIYPLSPRKDFITRDYLFWLLLTPTFTDFAIKGSARAGMPKVNREHLFSFRFHLPPLPIQLSIVSQLDALSTETKRLQSIYQQKLANLDELRKSLLKKAFNGEL